MLVWVVCDDVTDILEAGVRTLLLQAGGYLESDKGLISTVSTGTRSVLETELLESLGTRGTSSVQELELIILETGEEVVAGVL